jgi:hypothetical protein
LIFSLNLLLLMSLLLLLLLHEPQLQLLEAVDSGLLHFHREFEDSLRKYLFVAIKDYTKVDIINRLLFLEAVIIIMFVKLIEVLKFNDLACDSTINNLILEQLTDFVAHICHLLHLLLYRRYFTAIPLD